MTTQNTQSAGGIVLGPGNKVAVVSQLHDIWSLPKGHIEEGEDEASAAIREIREETGLYDLTLIQKIGSFTRYKIAKDGLDDLSELKTIHIYLFTTKETYLEPEDPDNPEAIWASIEEIPTHLSHPVDREFFQKVTPLLYEFIQKQTKVQSVPILITTTFPSKEEAEHCAEELLNQKKAACVQFLPIGSQYLWQGSISCAEEVQLQIKTMDYFYSDVEKLIQRFHSYDVPEIYATVIVCMSESYLAWMKESLG